MNYLKKKLMGLIEWILVGDSEKSHLEFQREVRKRKREQAAAADATKRRKV